MKLSTTFAALFSISAAAAQTTTPDDESMELIESLGLKDELPKPGYNMEGGSVFDNYVKARRDGQFFLFQQGIFHYETPLSVSVELDSLIWCSNLQFTSNINGTYSIGVGYTAQCVASFLGDSDSKLEAEGAQITYALTSDEFGSTRILSASYNIQGNMFDITSHNNDDNHVFLFSDSGLPSMPIIAWETHDEGDLTHPNADTSSWSGTGKATWVSTEEAALFLNNNATDFTPAKFVEIYEELWNDHHEYVGTGGESTNEEDEEEESTETDMEEADEDGSNNEESMTAAEDTEEERSESDTDNEEEEEESSASNGRRLFVAITSMFSTLLGSSV